MPGASNLWSFTGPVAANPLAGKNFTIAGPDTFLLIRNVTQPTTRLMITLLGAKMYGLLTDEQDEELKQIIESEMNLLEI